MRAPILAGRSILVVEDEPLIALDIEVALRRVGAKVLSTAANLKICWRFCTTALRKKLTRLHCSVGVSSMAFCQWALRSTT